MKKAREAAQKRAAVLTSRIKDYLNVRDDIPSGLSESSIKQQKELQSKIMHYFGVSLDDWNNYKWQIANRINSVEVLSEIVSISDEMREGIEAVEEVYRWAISPYYLSLMGEDPLDPIRLQAIPLKLEALAEGETDPMGEEFTNPAGTITRRYPDRLIINATNSCAMFCRHCQRRRAIGTKDYATSKDVMDENISYIKDHPEIRDVLITGGDPLTLSDDSIEDILRRLREIPHVEIIRIGTRTPVTLPQRITDHLTDMIKKYHPVYINVQYNHPREITPEAKIACEKLTNAGIPLGNQAVLLNGVNNNKYVMERLNQLLLMIRVKPYYIFHAKHVLGTTHFNTSIEDGLEIMEHLRGRTSGLAIPTYIVNAPLGQGKTPMLPQYLLEKSDDYYTIRTWEGTVIEYPNHKTIPLKDEIDYYKMNQKKNS